VCKLRRVSSPPVLVGSVSNSVESSFQRLADIIRLGRESRNYADLKAVEWWLMEDFGTDAETEWDEYEKVVCRSLGVESLELFRPRLLPPESARVSPLAVALWKATMNDRPYLVGRVGGVLGSPAPELLTHPQERESALARVRDVFRIGVRGQAFRDFVEAGRKQGKSEAEIVRQWKECEQMVLGLMNG